MIEVANLSFFNIPYVQISAMETRPKAIARVHLRIFQCKRKQRNITNEKISMKLKKYDDTFIASETITMAVPSTQYPVPCTHAPMH